MLSTFLSTLLSATPLLYVSVVRSGSAFAAHLSVRGAEDVELSLYELPRRARGSCSPPKNRTDLKWQSSFASCHRRSRICETWDGESFVKKRGRAGGWASRGQPPGYFKSWLGLEAPVGSALPSVPKAEVETNGDLIRAWRVDAPEPGWNLCRRRPEPARQPGLYSLVMRAEGGRAQTTVAVGELTALSVRAGGSFSLLAQERESGLPQAGVEIFVEKAGQSVLLGRTAADGVFTTRSPIPDLDGGAAREGALAFRERARSRADRPNRTPIGAVLPDRRIAQPGDAIGVWSLFRSIGAGDGRVSLPDSARGELQLIDREGRTILRRPLTLSVLGTATSELNLPLGLTPGDYTLAVSAGEERGAADLTVAEPGLAQTLPRPAKADRALGAGPVARLRDAGRDWTSRSRGGRPPAAGASARRTNRGGAESGAAITGEGGEIDIQA